LPLSGTRYAFLSMKIFLIKFFQKYKVIPGEKTNMGIAELDPHQFAAIKGGVWLKHSVIFPSKEMY